MLKVFAGKDCQGTPALSLSDANGCDKSIVMSGGTQTKKTTSYSCEDAMKQYVIEATFATSGDCIAKTNRINVKPVKPTGKCTVDGNGAANSWKSTCAKGSGNVLSRQTTYTYQQDKTCSTSPSSTSSTDLDTCMSGATNNEWTRRTCWDEITDNSGSLWTQAPTTGKSAGTRNVALGYFRYISFPLIISFVSY